jgi:hypothetical protein
MWLSTCSTSSRVKNPARAALHVVEQHRRRVRAGRRRPREHRAVGVGAVDAALPCLLGAPHLRTLRQLATQRHAHLREAVGREPAGRHGLLVTGARLLHQLEVRVHVAQRRMIRRDDAGLHQQVGFELRPIAVEHCHRHRAVSFHRWEGHGTNRRTRTTFGVRVGKP